MIDVTCAIIRNEDEEILVVQRGADTDHPYKWEFPGGKTGIGETAEDCIIREIDEELSINIIICGKLPPVKYDYGIKQINLLPFICDTLDELPVLAEHLDFKWSSPEKLRSFDFSEADVIVAEEYLKSISLNQSQGIIVTKEDSKIINLDDNELQDLVNRIMSMKEAEWIAASAIENPVVFKKLLEYSFMEDKKLAFRASWTLTKVCDRFPALIYPHIENIIRKLEDLDNESAERSFLRIISLSDFEMIPENLYGILADHCFKKLNSAVSSIAVKAYSMDIIYELSLKYPELSNELSASINMIQGEASAGVIARGRKILKKLSGK